MRFKKNSLPYDGILSSAGEFFYKIPFWKPLKKLQKYFKALSSFIDRRTITFKSFTFQAFDLSTMKVEDSTVKILSDTNNLLHRLFFEHQFHGCSFGVIRVYERDYQLCKAMPPPGGCWISGAPVHFWQNTSTSDSTYSFGKYLSALRHIAITVQREEESAESHAMGEVVSYSLARFLCSLRYYTSNSAA